MKIHTRPILGAVLVLTGLFSLKLPLWAGSPTERQELHNKLIEGARKEGKLVVAGISSLGEDGARAYGEAFKARFGLKNLRFEYDLEGYRGTTHSRAIMETKTGLPPTYDVMNATDHRAVTHMEAGSVQPIENWQALLPERVNARFASPSVVAGNAFLFATRIKTNSYNEKLISYEAMPRTTRDVGLPKFKDKFYLAPFPTSAQFGILLYSKEEWLKILEGWGRNKMLTLETNAGAQRMAVGEFAFEPFSNDYIHLRYKEKGDPIGMHLFEDLTPLSYIFYFVRKNALHANAAKLFTLWATGPEAVQVFEKYSWTGNVHVKESRIGATVTDVVNKKGGKVISWFDSPKNFEVLKWYATKEGLDYQDQFERALGLK